MNLLSKITDALRKPAPSVESVREAFELAQAEEARSAQAARDAETAALDPLNENPDAAVDALHRAEINARRASEARRQIEERLAARIREVAEDGRRASYDAALKARDRAADAIDKRYPQLAADLLDIVRLICEANIAIEKANADLPGMAEPLVSAETFARGLDRAETMSQGWSGARIVEMVIPNPDPTFSPLWEGMWGRAWFRHGTRMFDDDARREWVKRVSPFRLHPELADSKAEAVASPVRAR